jgi:hypothetical protein
VGRVVQHYRAGIRPVPEAQTVPVTSGRGLLASAAAPSASVPPSASTAPRQVPLNIGVPAVPKVVERAVQLDLTPSMGVTVTIDGAETRDVSSGYVLKLDGKAHALSFECSVCTPVQRQVAAGDKDETLMVKVPIKPATLDIDGPVDKTYQIVERPEIRVRAGVNTIPLGSQFEPITVKQIDSNTNVHVRLQAGKSVTATF